MSFLKTIFGRFFADDKPQPATPAVTAVGNKVEQAVAAVESETPQMLTIWTIERNRMAAPRALCTEIEIYPSFAVELHEGITGYVLDTPNGETVVIEASTGSLVGHTLENVRDGVRELGKGELRLQLDTARREFNRLKKHELGTDEFWKAVRMGSNDADVVQDFAE